MISLPSLLLHALKHVLWAMANANSSDAPIIKLCMCVCAGGGGGGGVDRGGHVGVQCERDSLFLPVLHDGIFKL